MRARRLASILLLTAIPAAASSRASLETDVTATCSDGAVTVVAKSPWRPNPDGPWKWDRGALVSKTDTQVRFKGSKCEGTVKAYIINGSQFKGPINVTIK